MEIVVFGAGMMGGATAYDLLRNKDIKKVTIVDIDKKKLKHLKKLLNNKKLKVKEVDVADYKAVCKVMRGNDAAVSCVTYFFNYTLACAAIDTGVSFCDLGGNIDIVDKEFLLNDKAKKAGITIIPDCGLAPGIVSILTAYAADYFDELDEVHLRVGGIPKNPEPPLNFRLSWSTAGLINEYKEPARVLKNYREETVESMDDLETLTLPEPFGKMEAFNTSGGISTLTRTFAGKIKNLTYKTIRYPGHCHIIKTLFDLGLADEDPIKDSSITPRMVLERALASRLGGDFEDAVIIRVYAKGRIAGKKRRLTMTSINYHDNETGLSAMMRATGFSISTIAQMLASGKIPQKGAVPQELCVPIREYIKEMDKKGIHIKIEESPAK